MTARESADIIPFRSTPRAPDAQTGAPPEVDPGARMRAALAALDAAITEQRSAVADWRTALNELRGTMVGLGESLHGYQDSLGTLDGQVTALGTTARTLEGNADTALGAKAD